ncbi:hypothetical protein CsSME_00018151 [Camellia sinensis var. sinensis]
MGLKSFIEIHPDSHFPIQNLPFGVFKPEPASDPRPGVAIGDTSWTSRRSLRPPNLNKFLGLGRPAWKEARATIQKLLSCMLFHYVTMQV